MKQTSFVARLYPEVGAGGYSSIDGTVEFYGRIGAILDKDSVVLDFGAGRGAWYEDDESSYRKATRLLKGKVKRVIACDVDEAVLENRSADEAYVVPLGSRLPLDDESIDCIVADYVFEHVTDVTHVVSEFRRVLRKGGWICSRTPSKYCYVAIVARLVANRRHKSVLKRAQPDRQERDVFPTAYKLNTLREISKAFSADRYDNFSYLYTAEPAYHFNSVVVFKSLEFFQWLMPKALSANIFVFLKKK